MTSEAILLLVLDAAIKGTLLLGVVGLVVWLFAKQRPALRALLWGQAFVALLVLPVASLLLPTLRLPIIPNVVMPQTVQKVILNQGRQVPDLQVVDSETTIFSEPPTIDDVIHETTSTPVIVNPSVVSNRWQIPDWPTLVLCLYILGVGICLLRVGIGFWQVHTLRLDVRRFAGPDVMARLDGWCVRLGMKDWVDVGISDRVSVPTVIGFFRPLVIVPEKVAQKGTDTDWDGILVHELAHVKRGDAYWNLLSMIVTALYWFHPLIYWARHDLADTRECACDDWAVHALGDTESYATTLMEVTARTNQRLSQTLGLDMARTSRVLHRVNRILNLNTHKVPEIGRVISVAILCVMLTSAGLLGSLRSADESSLSDQNLVRLTSGDKAAEWLREQFFLCDYVAGYREGERLITQFPDHTELKAWYMLHLHSDGQTDKAHQIATSMSDGNVWTDFARAFVWQNSQREVALHLSQRALMARVHDPYFLWLRAHVIWKAQGQDTGIAFIDEHVHRLENPAELLALKGNILAYQARNTEDHILQQQKWDEAFQTFKQAQRIDPNNVFAHYRHGFFLLTLQRKDEAYPLMRRAAQLSPHARGIHMRYWHTTLRMPNWGFETKRAEIETDMARFLKGREHYPEALSAVASLMNRDLNRPEEHQALSDLILKEFPNSEEAEWALVRQYRNLRSQLFQNEHESSEQLASIQERYREKLWDFVNRPVPPKTSLLGDAYRELFKILKTDSTARAEDLLRVVQGMVQYEKINPHYAFYFGPIALAEQTSFYREAEAIAKQGLEAVIPRGESNLQDSGAREDYMRSVNSMTARVHGALGWIFFQEGRFKDAEPELLKAYEIQPELWTNLHHLGQFYTHMEDWKQAESFFISGLKLQNWDGPSEMEMGLQNLYLKRYGTQEGFDTYRQMIKRNVEADQKKRIVSKRMNGIFIPEFTLESLNGSKLSQENFNNRIVVIDVGMRVHPNRLEELRKLYTRFSKHDDVVILHVSLDARLEEIARKRKYDFPMAMGYEFVKQTQIARYPTTLFLNRQGQVVYETIGSHGKNAWLRETTWRVEALLAGAL